MNSSFTAYCRGGRPSTSQDVEMRYMLLTFSVAWYIHSNDYFHDHNHQESDFKWNFNHFTGVDYNNDGGKHGIFRIYGENKYWSQAVDREHKNYDYLSEFHH
jgi:hypothetical protein